MKDKINKLKEFNEAFNINNAQDPVLRYKLMEEENNEYIQACNDKDPVEIADALGDMLYILCGTIINHGMEHIIEDVFNEIHISNMSKLDSEGKAIINGVNGVNDPARPLGKILKSPNFKEPNIEGILNGTYRPFKRYAKLS